MWHNKKSIHTPAVGSELGYTIIEVMIFLAISSALAVSALVGLSGQQRRTEFSQSAREAESMINDVMNDFVTGLSPTANTQFGPTGPGSCASIGGVAEQGTSIGCTYIGKVIQFRAGTPEDIRIFSVIGRQFKTGAGITPVENIIEARPVVLSSSTRLTRFGYGLPVAGLTVMRGGSVSEEIGAIGFFSSFAKIGSGSVNNDVSSGRQFTTIIAIPSSALAGSEADMAAAIENIVNYGGGGAAGYTLLENDYVNRPIRLCMLDNGQRAIISIGDNQQRAATKLTIDEQDNCA